MLNTTDEFEFEATDGNVYFVSVELDDGVVQRFVVNDHLAEELDEDHPMMDEIHYEVTNREYSVDAQSGTFEFYDQQLSHFGEENYKDIIS